MSSLTVSLHIYLLKLIMDHSGSIQYFSSARSIGLRDIWDDFGCLATNIFFHSECVSQRCRSGHREGSRSVTAGSGEWCPTFLSWPHRKVSFQLEWAKRCWNTLHQWNMCSNMDLNHCDNSFCLQAFYVILGLDFVITYLILHRIK